MKRRRLIVTKNGLGHKRAPLACYTRIDRDKSTVRKVNDGPQQHPPLFVDLDGTVVDADTLWLTLGRLLRTRPWWFAVLPFVVLRGRAAFKNLVTRLVELDPAALPYRRDVIDFLRDEKDRGRRVILATAAHRRTAEIVARHLGIFDDILATEGTRNVKGRDKLAAIREYAGDGVFDYVGDSMSDLVIFQAARSSFLVSPSQRLLELARDSCRVDRVFG